MLVGDGELLERVARIEGLLEKVENLEDAEARAIAAEVLGTLLDLYGEGLARVMETVAEGEGRERIFDALAADELVSHLLLLHGLHPLGLEERIIRALEEVRPYLKSHGGNVELLGVEGGVARLRMQGSCSGCPSSTATLKLAIEEAIYRTAPDLEGIEAENVAEDPAPRSTIVAGPTLRRKRKDPGGNGAAWTLVGGLPQLSDGGVLVREVSGEPVVFARLGDELYAYRRLCPGCGEPFESGTLEGSELRCSGCGLAYDVRRAGRCSREAGPRLEPIPLLKEDVAVEERQGRGRRSMVKLALSGAAG